MNKKIAKRVVLGLAAIYLLSYFIVSLGGFHEPIAYGALQGRDGRIVLAPKGSLGYHWIPFESYHQTGGIDGRSLHGWAYHPLLMVDRAVWHTSDKWKDRPDLTRNYFDYDAVEYRPDKRTKRARRKGRGHGSRLINFGRASRRAIVQTLVEIVDLGRDLARVGFSAESPARFICLCSTESAPANRPSGNWLKPVAAVRSRQMNSF